MKKLLICLVLAGFTLPAVLPASSGQSDQEQSQQQTKKNRKKRVKRAKKSKKAKLTAKLGPAA